MKTVYKYLKSAAQHKLVIILFLLSLIPLLWYPDAFEYEVYGRGDYISPFNTNGYYKMNLYTYDIYYQGGNYAPSQLAHIFYLKFFQVFNNLGYTSAGATLIFISLNLFIAQISVCALLKFLLEKENVSYSSWLRCFPVLVSR